MQDLEKFAMSDMVECSSALRKMGQGATSMEEVAQRIVHYLFENTADPETKAKSCTLVRFYKTHPFGKLEPELQVFARKMLGGHNESPTIKCLTLLATVGERPEWNARKTSEGHKAIPLPSEQAVASIPMIAQLISQFGLEISALLEPDRKLLVDLEQKSYNLFFVPDALGSPFIPAQEHFVVPFGIKSVLGFGGMLPDGDLFAIILFARVSIPRETAELFRTVALSAKAAILPFAGGVVFSPQGGAGTMNPEAGR